MGALYQQDLQESALDQASCKLVGPLGLNFLPRSVPRFKIEAPICSPHIPGDA